MIIRTFPNGVTFKGSYTQDGLYTVGSYISKDKYQIRVRHLRAPKSYKNCSEKLSITCQFKLGKLYIYSYYHNIGADYSRIMRDVSNHPSAIYDILVNSIRSSTRNLLPQLKMYHLNMLMEWLAEKTSCSDFFPVRKIKYASARGPRIDDAGFTTPQLKAFIRQSYPICKDH